MNEKSKNMDLEVVELDTNEAVPAVEVEQKKKKKGWTLFRSNKSKSEENAKKEIFNEGEPSKVKIISVKPKNMDEEVKEDDKGNPKAEIIIKEKIKRMDKMIDEIRTSPPQPDVPAASPNISVEESHPVPEESPVLKKRWYQWFGKKSQRKNKLVEVTPDTETTDAQLVEDNPAPLASEEPSKVTEFDEIEVIDLGTPPAEFSDKRLEDAVVDTSEPEKRKRLTLRFFKRSSKKNKKEKVEEDKISPTETIEEEITIRLSNTDMPEEDIDVQPTDAAENVKIEIVEAEELIVIENAEIVALPIAEDVKEVVEDKPADEGPKEGSSTEEETDKPENVSVTVAAAEKRKKFSLFSFLRRSTKKDSKSSSEATPTESVEKEAENNETGPESEKTEAEKDETVEEAPKDEIVQEAPKNECPAKSDEPNDIKDVKDDKLPTEEAPELAVGDTANIGDAQIVDEPKNDDKMQIDDVFGKTVSVLVEGSMDKAEEK